MQTKPFAIRILAVVLAGWTPLQAQTASEQLQKGIYNQETAGDLDGAIQIYRQIVASSPGRDIAAQAQFRLAQSLVQKGDLVGAAQEYQKLAQEYSNYRDLISKLAGVPQQANLVKASVASGNYDSSHTVMVRGVIKQVAMVNPVAYIVVSGSPNWVFALGAPNTLVRFGFQPNAMKVGDEVIVSGLLSADGKPTDDGSISAMANKITLSGSKVDGHYPQVFDRAALEKQASLDFPSTPRFGAPGVTFTQYKEGEGYDAGFSLGAMQDRDKAEMLAKGAPQYNSSWPCTVKGVVASVAFANPTAYIFVTSGQTKWGFALAAPNTLIQNGWTKDSVKAGDTITVSGFPAADTTSLASPTVRAIANQVILSDGKQLFDRATLQAK